MKSGLDYEPEVVPCVPCEHCAGTGSITLAPKPPPSPEGDPGRLCSGCQQRFPLHSYCGHSTYNPYRSDNDPDWWCSPVCYTKGTGDTGPWGGPRPPEVRVRIITLF